MYSILQINISQFGIMTVKTINKSWIGPHSQTNTMNTLIPQVRLKNLGGASVKPLTHSPRQNIKRSYYSDMVTSIKHIY